MSDNINQKALKAGMWYTLSNFFIKGMTFLTTPIFTRLLSKSDYGQFSNYASWLSLLTIITTLELYVSVNRAKFDFQDDLDGYLSSIAITGSLFTGLCYFVVICFPNFFVNLFNMDMLYIHTMFLYLLFEPALVLLNARYRLEMKYKLVTFLTLISNLSSIVLSLILVFTMKNQLLGRVLGNNIPVLLLNIILYVIILKKGHKLSMKHCTYALAISIPLLPHVLAGNILGTTDRIMITEICGPEFNAIYSVTYSCSLIISVLMNSVNQAWSPWFYEKLNSKEYSEIRSVSKKYITAFSLCAFLIMLCGPEVLLLFGGEKYAEAIALMPPIMLGCALQFLYTLYVNVGIFHKQTLGISIRTSIAAIVNIVTNAILIPKYGYQAAAYTTLLGYFILFVLHYLSSRKFDSDQYYDNKYIWILALAMSLLSFVAFISYGYTLLRYAIIIAFVCVIVYNLYKYRYKIKNAMGR